MTDLSKPAQEILEHMEFVGGDVGLSNCEEVTELIKKGYLGVELSPWQECFYAACYITRQGIAVVKGLH